MAKSAMMTVRLSPETSEKLEALARDTKRSKSYLATEAIEAYVNLNAWQVARIKEALEEAESGAPGIPHEDVVKWMESWGTDHELPTPRKSSRPMEIIWRPIAIEDVEEARRYIARDNPAAADRVVLAIRSAVGRLGNFPHLGRPGRVERTRELVVTGTPYIVAYAVVNEQLMILSVVHGARNWPESF